MIRTLRRSSVVRSLMGIATGLIVLAGCGQTGPVMFESGGGQPFFSMTSPSVSGDLFHRDALLMAEFRFDRGACFFRIQNISPHALELRWSKATMTIGRLSSLVRMYDTYYAEVPTPADVILPPLGYQTDLLIPADHVVYADGDWHEFPLLSDESGQDGQVLGIVGDVDDQTIRITVPVWDQTQDIPYTFEFVSIGGTLRGAEEEELPRRPAPPARPQAGRSDQLLTGGIVLGFAALVVLILSIDRESPIPE